MIILIGKNVLLFIFTYLSVVIINFNGFKLITKYKVIILSLQWYHVIKEIR